MFSLSNMQERQWRLPGAACEVLDPPPTAKAHTHMNTHMQLSESVMITVDLTDSVDDDDDTVPLHLHPSCAKLSQSKHRN